MTQRTLKSFRPHPFRLPNREFLTHRASMSYFKVVQSALSVSVPCEKEHINTSKVAGRGFTLLGGRPVRHTESL